MTSPGLYPPTRRYSQMFLMNFNPRSCEGSDFLPLDSRGNLQDFNPRSREGSDLIHCQFPVCSCVFQSTLPRGERHDSAADTVDNITFQSTLPRGERRWRRQWSGCIPHISIHAPARGATQPPKADNDKIRISIHAPARGATQ